MRAAYVPFKTKKSPSTFNFAYIFVRSNAYQATGLTESWINVYFKKLNFQCHPYYPTFI